MPNVETITTRDADTIEVVEVFKVRKGIGTYSEAMEKLIARAKDAGLHLHDASLVAGRIPVLGTIGDKGSVKFTG
jgi:hypothetical protein